MLTHPVIDKLHQLKCLGMATALTEQLQSTACEALSFEERLALLVDRELTVRDDRRMTSRLRRAKLRHPNACIEDIDFRSPRGLDKSLVLSLASGALAARAPQRPHHRTVRRGQVLARLRTGSSGLPRRILRPVPAPPAAAARPRRRPRRRLLSEAARLSRQARHHRARRLRTRQAQPRQPPRPPRTPRGPLRHPFHPGHQPAPDRELATTRSATPPSPTRSSTASSTTPTSSNSKEDRCERRRRH